MDFENLTLERDGAIAVVTINRPKVLNALNTQTMDELAAAMADDEKVKPGTRYDALRMLGMELAGSSPEPLVRVEGRTVTTRPIAGVAPSRGRNRPSPSEVNVQLS